MEYQSQPMEYLIIRKHGRPRDLCPAQRTSRVDVAQLFNACNAQAEVAAGEEHGVWFGLIAHVAELFLSICALHWLCCQGSLLGADYLDVLLE
jgi:hypothetical protein